MIFRKFGTLEKEVFRDRLGRSHLHLQGVETRYRETYAKVVTLKMKQNINRQIHEQMGEPHLKCYRFGMESV